VAVLEFECLLLDALANRAQPAAALAALLARLEVETTELPSLEGLTESPGPGSFYQSDQSTAYGQHHGPVPLAYHSRHVRRLSPGELP
jgi:hypothetical protein